MIKFQKDGRLAGFTGKEGVDVFSCEVCPHLGLQSQGRHTELQAVATLTRHHDQPASVSGAGRGFRHAG